jgi:hypothetical protein
MVKATAHRARMVAGKRRASSHSSANFINQLWLLRTQHVVEGHRRGVRRSSEMMGRRHRQPEVIEIALVFRTCLDDG